MFFSPLSFLLVREKHSRSTEKRASTFEGVDTTPDHSRLLGILISGKYWGVWLLLDIVFAYKDCWDLFEICCYSSIGYIYRKKICLHKFWLFECNGKKIIEAGESEITLKEGLSEYFFTSLELHS